MASLPWDNHLTLPNTKNPILLAAIQSIPANNATLLINHPKNIPLKFVNTDSILNMDKYKEGG